MQALRASCLLLVTFALFVAPFALAQSEDVDALVAAELQRQGIPGLSIAVMRGGEIVKAQGYGLANVEHDCPGIVGLYEPELASEKN